MKKIVFLFAASLLFSTFSEAAISRPAFGETVPVYDFFYPVKTPLMTLQEFETLTGKKLNVIQKIAFKIAQKKMAKSPAEGKSQLTAALLAFFLGALGIHRFYLGYTWQGVVQLLTLGGLGIWALIDFVRILTGSLQPKDGQYAKTL